MGHLVKGIGFEINGLGDNRAIGIFVEDDLGHTIHDNNSEGHLASSPMRGAIVHYTAAQREDGTEIGATFGPGDIAFAGGSAVVNMKPSP